jgi:hypothetical protein
MSIERLNGKQAPLAVLPDQELEHASLRCEGGRIVEIVEGSVPFCDGELVVDGHGLVTLPGMIDLHGDMLEREIEPRPGARFPIDMALPPCFHPRSGYMLRSASGTHPRFTPLRVYATASWAHGQILGHTLLSPGQRSATIPILLATARLSIATSASSARSRHMCVSTQATIRCGVSHSTTSPIAGHNMALVRKMILKCSRGVRPLAASSGTMFGSATAQRSCQA